MSIRIAVFDPLPAYRRGIMASLDEAGLQPEAPRDLLEWALAAPRQVILMTLESSDDWSLLVTLRAARPDLPIVAVIPDASVPAQVRAIVSGATAALPRDATPETVQQVLKAAADGVSVLPTEVVRALSTRREAEPSEPGLSDRELEWLRELAKGTTVAQLAERAGYSERAMFRLLRTLYGRLQVRNRTEALMHAQQRGWL
jgi:DNA-binding NarL/FixJ family response regulator